MDMTDQNQHSKAEITQRYLLFPTLTALQPEDMAETDSTESRWRTCFALLEHMRSHQGILDSGDQEKYLDMLYKELKYLCEHSGYGGNQGLLSAKSDEQEDSPQKLNARSTADIMFDYEKGAAYVPSVSNNYETPMDGTTAREMVSRSTEDILECYTR